MVDVPRGLNRAERLTVAAATLGILVFYAWTTQFRLDHLDEGYFIYTSSRVFYGDLPYRDFSTPYTPAFFYVNSLLFKLFGLEILVLRLWLVPVRVGMLVLVYLLGRRIMPPAFALLPVLILVVEDQSPGVWESHPAWPAAVLFVLSAYLVCRHYERGGFGWWLGAAVTATASFAFKQNIGIFALAALVAVSLSEARALPTTRAPSWLARLGVPLPRRYQQLLLDTEGWIVLLALCLGTAWGMRKHLEPVVLVNLSLPFAVLALLKLRESRQRLEDGPELQLQRLAATRERLGLLVLTFVALTLPWMAALTAALGARETPFNQFVGAIDTAGYFYEMDPLRPRLRPALGLVALGLLAAWGITRRWPLIAKALLVAGCLALAGAFSWELLRTAPEVEPRVIRATILLTVDATANLLLYLPIPAVYAGLGLLLSDRVAPCRRFYLRWYLLAGSLLMLNQYPRLDQVHLLFSAPLIWIVGAYALWRLHRWLLRERDPRLPDWLARGAIYAALGGLLGAALWPTIEARRSDLFHRQSGFPPRITHRVHEPVDLPGTTGIKEVDTFAWKYRDIAAWFRANGRPGERIFVYPASPLFYFLLERPNATRFNHVFPGLLSPEDEQDSIRRLAETPAEYVIWDAFGAEFWGSPDVDKELQEYIWKHYQPVASMGGYEILRRSP